MFHVAKHAIKFTAFSHDYDVSSLPIDEQGVINDVFLKVSGHHLDASQLRNTLFYAPNINSFRRIKVKHHLYDIGFRN